MKKSQILVTGGAGYIGSHALRSLPEDEFDVVVVDNLVYGHREAVSGLHVKFIEGDLADQRLMEKLFREHRFDAVMHFAAYAYVGESVENPAKYYQNNLAAPLNLLDCMRYAGCNRFIFSSTCATYGSPQYVPIDENHPQNPINPYGTSKYMLERILMDYRHAYQVQYAILRYFNASGAAADGSIGEDHNPETHLIPLILDAVTGERPHITIYGDDYDTPDGTCIRDYIHVEDLALAHTAALRYLLQNNSSLICNLGTGTGYSVREVIHAVEKVTKKKVPTEIGSRRSGDPDKLVADPSHAEKILGWKAGYQHIEDIVSTAWKWKTGNKKGKYSN